MKILFVNYRMNIGGIESFLLNITKELVKQKHHIDFLCYKDGKYDLDKEIKDLKCNIYRINDPDKVSSYKHFKELYNFLKNNKYDVIHCNTYTDSGLVMFAAFLAGIKVRVTHSHTSQKPKSLKQKIKWFIGKMMINIFSNKKIACSKVAGESLYLTNKFVILENGVDLNKYIFNKDIRNKIRKELLVKENEILIGHVGRFVPVKNHEYIIDLFKELDDNYKLLLIGDGPDKTKIEKLVRDYKLKDRVIFTGNIRNTNEYLNAIDLILFPSLYEGLPVSLVEAQMNGLQIIASNTISKEINFFGNVHFFDLNDSKENIKDIIKKTNKRNINNDYFKNSNYNIENTVSKIISIYKD